MRPALPTRGLPALLLLGAGVASAAPPRAPTAAPSAAAPGVCGALTAAVESAEKDISAETADEVTEDSAPRAAVEEMKINAAYQKAQANIALMAQHHCTPHSHPVEDADLVNAITCKTDRLNNLLALNTATPGSCDRAKWTRAD
jgi:hypothetical protein